MVEWLAGNRIRGTTAERPSASLQSPSVGGWKEVGRTTLGSNSSSISVDSLADKRYYMILSDFQVQGTNNDHSWRFNNDSGSNYATRYNYNGQSDGTFTSQGQIVANGGTASRPNLNIVYVANKSDKEKLLMSHINQSNSSGAADTMTRSENVGKWANTSNAISRIDAVTSNGGGYNSGSEVVVLGFDPTDTHTTNFWEELDSVTLTADNSNLTSNTFSAKKYLWVQFYFRWNNVASDMRMTFNGDSGNNYSRRRSGNGGSDGTYINQAHNNFETSTIQHSALVNMFMINNASNEKLFIFETAGQMTAGANNAPDRRVEGVGKWSNTSDQITSLNIFTEVATARFVSGTTMKIWGSD
jgi:hypothetical protein